jgi:hypothetical protein
VPHVHPDRDLRLPAVAAEVALSDQQPDEQALVAFVHGAQSTSLRGVSPGRDS